MMHEQLEFEENLTQHKVRAHLANLYTCTASSPTCIISLKKLRL